MFDPGLLIPGLKVDQALDPSRVIFKGCEQGVCSLKHIGIVAKDLLFSCVYSSV
jgi:hypothetical protein